jgi:hypothetical protein
MTACRYCKEEATHGIPFETREDTERAAKFIRLKHSTKQSGVVSLCDACHETYGEYIRTYYSPRFELGGAL